MTVYFIDKLRLYRKELKFLEKKKLKLFRQIFQRILLLRIRGEANTPIPNFVKNANHVTEWNLVFKSFDIKTTF